MKIVAFGFPPGTPAGMGIVTERILSRLARFHNVTLVSPGAGGAHSDFDVISTPPVGSVSPMDVLQNTIQKVEPDVFWTNQNWQGASQITGLLNSYYQSTGNEIDAIFHAPIETEEPPPGFEERFIVDHLTNVHLVPYTNPTYELFSGETVSKPGGSWEYCRTFIPHGVDDLYRQQHPPGQFRSMLGVDADTHIVMTNAGNEGRKNLDDWLEAAGNIATRHDDVVFGMHSSTQPKRGDPLYGGWELPRIAAVEGLTPNENIFWTKEYPVQNVPRGQLAAMYTDADVYLSLSGGEGFGLPIAEALAAGTPCVLTDHVNHRWVAADGAEYVPTATTERMRTGDKLLRADTEAAAELVDELLTDPDRREEMGAAGQDRVAEFTWDRAAREWHEYLESEVKRA